MVFTYSADGGAEHCALSRLSTEHHDDDDDDDDDDDR